MQVQASSETPTVRVLITSGASRLAQALADSLGVDHDVVLTDRRQVPTDHDFVRSELGHDETTNELVRGVDVIVHPGEPDSRASVPDQLDAAMRCTYNLLIAAVEEGVPRLVYLSSLSLLNKYDEDLVVTEGWRPLPTTKPRDLSYHLGEFVCNEFARQGKINAVRLRLGELVEEGQGAQEVSTSALYVDDAVQAVESAITANIPRWWGVVHVQSDVPNARYMTQHVTGAKTTLGFEPPSRA